ncbi:g9740 [Coccomyxa elongata]
MGGVQSIGAAGCVSRAGWNRGPCRGRLLAAVAGIPGVPEARMPGSRDLTNIYACLEVLQLRAPGERCCNLGIASTAQAGLCGGTLSLAYGTRTTGLCCRLRC